VDEVLKELRKFRDDRNWKQFHTPEKLAISVVLEAAELLENFQWDHVDAEKENVKDEIADVVNYCLLLCDHYGFDIREILLEKIDKNKKKYPVQKARGTAKKYTDL